MNVFDTVPVRIQTFFQIFAGGVALAQEHVIIQDRVLNALQVAAGQVFQVLFLEFAQAFEVGGLRSRPLQAAQEQTEGD